MLIQITCFYAQELKSIVKVVSGIDEDSARRIVGASRNRETDSKAAFGTIAHFSSPMFGGESYGLALALADKITRHGAKLSNSQIIATGVIPADGCGRVESVEDISSKIQITEEKAKRPGIFVLPKANLEGKFLETWQALDRLENKGVNWVAISHVDDLDNILWQGTQEHQEWPLYQKLMRKGRESTNDNLNSKHGMAAMMALMLLALLGALFWGLNRYPNSDVDESASPQKVKIINENGTASVETGSETANKTLGVEKRSTPIESMVIDTSKY
ncbi:MAG: hypothetical protein KZQ96_20745 [Candidatus Thiodiazotropha sp. (ex Lucinoma borealis)]|nr:hypothetical protein [Candidatus Thiodiazotropha sp. (ex Lucinoma borealis)]